MTTTTQIEADGAFQRRCPGALRVLLVGGLLVLSSCASYEPLPLKPSEELAELAKVTLDGVEVQRERAGQGEQPQRQGFDLSDGLNESELTALALRLNPGLKAKHLEVGLAEALLITAGLWPNPQVGVGWRPGLGSASGYTLDAAFLFQLLAPGERGARVDAAKAQTATVRAEVLASEWQLVAETRRDWLDVLSGEKTVELLGKEATLRAEAVAYLKRRRELGEGTELDVATAELESAQIQRDVRLATTELESSRRALNQRLGLPPQYRLPLTDSTKPLSITVFEDLSDKALEQRLLSGRFELRALEATYEQAEHELRLAVAKQFPRLKLGPSFGTENDGGNYLGFGLSLLLPLFDRNQGEIAEKESQRALRRAEYVALLHSLKASAHDRRARLRRAKGELDAQDKGLLPVLARTRSIFQRAFESRDISVLEWVTARQRALTAERGYLEALVRYRRGLIELESATGLPLSTPVKRR